MKKEENTLENTFCSDKHQSFLARKTPTLLEGWLWAPGNQFSVNRHYFPHFVPIHGKIEWENQSLHRTNTPERITQSKSLPPDCDCWHSTKTWESTSFLPSRFERWLSPDRARWRVAPPHYLWDTMGPTALIKNARTTPAETRSKRARTVWHL